MLVNLLNPLEISLGVGDGQVVHDHIPVDAVRLHDNFTWAIKHTMAKSLLYKFND